MHAPFLLQPRCGHYRYKAGIHQSSLGAGTIHHASTGILSNGTGGVLSLAVRADDFSGFRFCVITSESQLFS